MLWHRDTFPGAKISTVGCNSSIRHISPALKVRQIFAVHLDDALISFSAFHALDQNSIQRDYSFIVNYQ